MRPHNPHPRAPEHLSMVNPLIIENAKKDVTEDGTHLNLMKSQQWKKLREHALYLALLMTRCCFQCGIHTYPSTGDIILVDVVSRSSAQIWHGSWRMTYTPSIYKTRAELPLPSCASHGKRAVTLPGAGTLQILIGRHGFRS